METLKARLSESQKVSHDGCRALEANSSFSKQGAYLNGVRSKRKTDHVPRSKNHRHTRQRLRPSQPVVEDGVVDQMQDVLVEAVDQSVVEEALVVLEVVRLCLRMELDMLPPKVSPKLSTKR